MADLVKECNEYTLDIDHEAMNMLVGSHTITTMIGIC